MNDCANYDESSMPSGKRFWTTADVIDCLGISESKFAYLRAMGKMVLPVAQLGKALRFHGGEVRAWACAGGPSVAEWEAIKKRRGLVFDGENL
jgi:hypothetical protein